MGSPQTCCCISSSEFVYEAWSVRDCPQLGMTENGLSEPIMCNSHWQRLSPEDMARSGSGQFFFPKASSKFQNSIKCSFGQLCNTNVCCPVERGVQPQPAHLLQADGLTWSLCVPGWHFQISKGSLAALRSAIWLLTHWQATRSTNGTWPCLMDSGDGAHLLGAARTTKVRTQPDGPLVKSQQNIQKLLVNWRGLWWGKIIWRCNNSWGFRQQAKAWEFKCSSNSHLFPWVGLPAHQAVNSWQCYFFFSVWFSHLHGWSYPLKGWLGQESVTVQWHCHFQFAFRLPLEMLSGIWSSCNNCSLSQGHFLEINDRLGLTVSAPPCWSLVPGNTLMLWFPMAPIDTQHSCENINRISNGKNWKNTGQQSFQGDILCRSSDSPSWLQWQQSPLLFVSSWEFLATYWTNPQFKIRLDEPDDDRKGSLNEPCCTILVGLMQKNRRRQKRMGEGLLSIGYSLYRVKFVPHFKDFFSLFC